MNNRLIVAIIAITIAGFSLMGTGCQAQIDPRNVQIPRPAPDPNSPLIGTRWYGGGRGIGSTGELLYFESAERVIFTRTQNPPPNEQSLDYFFDSSRLRGEVPLLGEFVVTENYEGITFPTRWRHHSCGADFRRVHEN